jgi:type I restriction enzyme S subunit
MRVKIGDVVNKIVGDEDRLNTEREYYVGGEHIDSSRMLVKNRGLLKSDKGKTLGYQFHYPFERRDVLFMTKNPYLRKCGMADFQGICSIATFVMRSKDEDVLTQEYLAVIMQTDDLWNYLEANKSGSVNYFITWKTLEKYEFELPDIETQKKIAKIAWQFEKTHNTYEEMLANIDELIKSQFIEVIQPLLDKKNTVPLGTIVENDRPITYGILKPGISVQGGVPVIKVKDMKDGFIDQTDLLFTTPEIDNNYKRSRLRAGDLLISIRGSIGRMAEVPENLENANITQDTARLSIKKEYNKVFIRGVLESHPLQYDMEKNIRGVAVKGINIGYLRDLEIPVCNRDKQDELAALYMQSDKSKFELKKAIKKLEKAQAKFVSENC